MRKTPVVLGTLSIIFGSLTAAWSLFAPWVTPMFQKFQDVMHTLAPNDPVQAAQMEGAVKSLEATSWYMYLSCGIFELFSIVLIVIGVGLRSRRPWARRAAVYWSAAGLAWLTGSAIYTIGWLQPLQRAVQHQVYAEHGVTPVFELSAGSQAATVVFSMIFYAAFN